MVNDPATLDRLIYGELQDSRASASAHADARSPGKMLVDGDEADGALLDHVQPARPVELRRRADDSIKLNDDGSVTCTFDEIIAGQYSDALGQGNIEDRRITCRASRTTLRRPST